MLFSTVNPKLQLYWDAHSLSTLQTCPRKYQYQILMSYIASGSALDLEWGIAYHDSLAEADIAKINGADHTECLLIAVEKALDRPEFESANNYKNRFTLVRSVVWNLDHFRESRQKHLVIDGKPAVELNFSFQTQLQSSTGEYFGLCGYMDGVVETDMGIVVKERKTTKNSLSQDYFDRFNPNLQVSMYTLASRIIFPEPARGVEVEAVQTGVNFSEFAQRIFIKTPAQVQEFHDTVAYWISRADEYAQKNYWPMNEASCAMCPFKSVCRKDPAVREAFLEDPSHFKKREWNPLEPR